MTKKRSHAETWAKINAIAAVEKNHDHEDEHYHYSTGNDNERQNSIPSRNIHDHDAELNSLLKIRMSQIQQFVNRDAEAQYALKNYEGLDPGVLVNACKGLGTTKVKAVLERVRKKPLGRIRKSKGEYLTGALKMEVQNKGFEWEEWNVNIHKSSSP